jgi:tRNA 2-thiocytidine biosynthesis protein TtcA
MSTTILSPISETPENTQAAIESANKKAKIKLEKRLRGDMGRAIADYNMIEDGDKIMVCLSGGKDSFTMLSVLQMLQKRAPIKFEIIAVNLDQKQPGFPEHILPEYLKQQDVEFHILNRDTYSVVKDTVPEGKTTCGICSRLRRSTLYAFANQIGATKVALGHHRDDIIETLFLNMFHGGSLKAMPPKLLADSGDNILIRPMAYCKESDIIEFANTMDYPIIPCNLCGSQENLQRQNIKAMLNDWQTMFPGRIESIFKATQNIAPSQLGDGDHYDFVNLKTNAIPTIRLDKDKQYDPMATTNVDSFWIDAAEKNS